MTYSWRSEAVNGRWDYNDNWWNGSGYQAPQGGDVIRFGNGVQLTMTNDLPNANRYRIYFDSVPGARTITGSTANTFYDYGGNAPLIQNDSGNTQTIGFKIINGNSASGNALDLVANSGDLVFNGDVSASGAPRNIYAKGAANLYFNGAVMQESGATLNFTKEGNGTAFLTASNSYTGTTTVSAGVLQISNSYALGTTDNGTTVASGAALQLGNGITIAGEALTISGTGISSGGALRSVSGSNAYTGLITASSALTSFGAATNTTLLISNVNSVAQEFWVVGDGTTIVAGGATNSGSGTAFVKTNTGTAILSASNAWSGAEYIRQGTVILSNNNALGTGGTTYLGAADAGSSATATITLGSGIINSNTINVVGSGTGARTLGYQTDTGTGTQLGNIELNNSSLAFNIATNGTLLFGGGVSAYTGGTDTNRLAVDGGGTLIVTNAGTGIASTERYQVRIGNGTLIIGGGSIIARTSVTGLGHAIDLGVDLSNNIVNATSALYASNGVTVSNSIYVSTTGSAARVIGLSGTNLATFSGPIGLNNAALTVTAAAGGTTLVSGTITNYTGSTPANNGLIKTGSGTVTISGTNTFGGVTTINEGTISISVERNLGINPTNATADAITLNGGTLATTASIQMTQFRGITLGASGGTVNVASSTTVSQTSGGLGVVGTGALTKTGAGTYSFNSVNGNTFTGNLIVQEGVFRAIQRTAGVSFFGDTNTGVVELNGGSLEIVTGGYAGLTGRGIAANNNATILIDRAGTYKGDTMTFGALTIGGQTLTINGGTQSQSGTQGLAFSGAVTVSGGAPTFSVNKGGGGAMAALIFSNTVDNGGQLLTFTGDGNSLALGAVSGTGGITKSGTGTLLVGGVNTYTGSNAVSAGTLFVNNASGLGATSAGTTVDSGAALYFGGTNSYDAEPITINGAGFNGTNGALRLANNATNNGLITLASDSTIRSDGFGVIAARITNASGTQSLTVDTATNGILSIDNNDGISLGSGSLTKIGDGKLYLYNSNNYTGATTVSAGILSFFNKDSLGSTDGATTVASGASVTISGALTVAESFFINGGGNGTSGALHGSAGSSTLTGLVTLQSDATISVATLLTLTHSGGITGNNLNLTFNSQGNGVNRVVSNITLGSGGVTKTNTGTLLLAGTNTYTGTTTVKGGTLILSNGSAINDTAAVSLDAGVTLVVTNSETIGSLRGGVAPGGSVSIASGQTLTVAETGSQTYAGVISNTGGLTKSAAGTLTLSGTNTYTGTTTVSAGNLAVNGKIASTTTTVTNTGVLSGSGSIAGTTTIAAGGTISPGYSVGTLSVTNLAFGTNGNYNWQLYDATGTAGATNGYDTIAGAGTLNISANSTDKFNINLWTLSGLGPETNGSAINFVNTNSYTWTLGTWASITGFDPSYFNITTAATNGTGGFANSFNGTFSLSSSNNSIFLNYAAGTDGTPTYSAASGTWSTNFTPALYQGAPNWIFDGATGGAATNNIASGTINTLGTLTFSNTAGSYTLSADSGSAGYDASSALAITGNIVNNSANAQTINLALGFSNAATINAAAGHMTFGGAISNGTSLTFTGASNNTVSGAISGAGYLVKDGAGTLVLSGNNTYTGGTLVSTGTLQVGAGGTSGSLSTSALTNNATLAFNRSDALTASYAISGTGALTKDGAGTLTLSGNNSYGGTTTISNGAISISVLANAGSNSGIGTNATVTFAGANATNTVLDYTGGNVTTDRTFAFNGTASSGEGGTINMASSNTIITATGSASGTGKMILSEGTLVLSNTGTPNSFAPAAIQVDTGATLQLADNHQIGNTTGLILNGGTFRTGTSSTGFSDTLGTLTLSASSTIDLGAWTTGLRTLTFADSSAISWTGVLTITNWQGVAHQSSSVAEILFGTGGLTSTQLGQIYFANQTTTGGELIGGGGELVPIPEPRVYAAAAALLAAIAWRERKRVRALLAVRKK